jgi:hypothetical protein
VFAVEAVEGQLRGQSGLHNTILESKATGVTQRRKGCVGGGGSLLGVPGQRPAGAWQRTRQALKRSGTG